MHQVRREIKIKKTVSLGITAGFYYFPKQHTKILLGDFVAKVERENIFKPTIRNENLHQDINDK
jgi:hypothetical protein